MKAFDLRAADLVDPLGLPDTEPTLSWRIEGRRRPVSVRVEVFDGPEPAGAKRLAVVKVDPDVHSLPWPGVPLRPGQRVSWSVHLEGEDAEPTSEIAHIETAPAGLGAARPITHPAWLEPGSNTALPELAHRFELEGAPVRARLALAVEGVAAVEINGIPALGSQLDPGYGTPGGTVPAIVRDVTAFLHAGTNEIVVRLGGGVSWVPRLAGRYTKFARTRRPWVAAHLITEAADGSTTEITTSRAWQARLGATAVAHWYGGEDWVEASESAWTQAVELPLGFVIRWRAAPPQASDGMLPSTVPELVVFDYDRHKQDQTAFRDDPNWGRALVELPWRLYRHTGDIGGLKTAWPAAQRYLAYLESRSVDGLLDHGLGDWIELDDSTPRALVASAGWWESLHTAAAIAYTLGDPETGARYDRQAQTLRDRIEAVYLNGGTWGSGSQASLALGWLLAANQESRNAAVGTLLARIRADDNAITVGEIALPHFLRALADSGHSSLIDELIRRVDAPGYGHQVASGATALTESWTGPKAPFGQASQNHFMLGVIDEWILGDVVGLRQQTDSVGWARVRVRPTFLDSVEWIEESFLSPRGRIRVAWRRTESGIELDVEAPPTVDVEVQVPSEVKVKAGIG